MLPLFFFGQNNKMSIKAVLMQDYKILIDQEITYFNHSDSILDTIYLLNWANSYKDKTTPLTRRLIEDYNKSLYFANIKDRGYSAIRSLTCDNLNVYFRELRDAADIIKVVLPNSLNPGDSTKIEITYEIKVPKDKYTRYGRNPLGYKLRYWHITPAVFNSKWHLFSNLNMDDHYMHPADIDIEFSIPLGYTLNSDLEQEVIIKEDHVLYKLKGKNRLDTELSIQPRNDYSIYPTTGPDIVTNIKSKNLTENIKVDVLQANLTLFRSTLERTLIQNYL